MAGRGRDLRRLNKANTASKEMTLTDAAKEDNMSLELIAKFTYKANPDHPGGFHEVSMKQGEHLWLVKKGHDDNHHWWLVKKEDGTSGYVPADYLMQLETKPTSLPWLVNRKDVENETENQVGAGNKFGCPDFKPYKSAYGNNKKDESEYYCKICERSFNGPMPFRAHMNSKSHREEVEIAKQYGRA